MYTDAVRTRASCGRSGAGRGYRSRCFRCEVALVRRSRENHPLCFHRRFIGVVTKLELCGAHFDAGLDFVQDGVNGRVVGEVGRDRGMGLDSDCC